MSEDSTNKSEKIGKEALQSKDRGGIGNDSEESFFSSSEKGSVKEISANSDVDPELLRLPRRRRRHPLINVIVILLSIYLMFSTHAEFFYFWHSKIPVDVGQVQEALQQGKLKENIYVKVSGAPDRKHSVLLEGNFSEYDSLFRLLQSESMVFVKQHRETRSTDREVEAIHIGRLMQFSKLPYYKNVSLFFSKTMTSAHDLDFPVVVKALANKQLNTKVVDRMGESVQLGPDSIIWINVAYPNEWIIQFSKKTYKTLDDAKAKVSSVNLPLDIEENSSDLFWKFVVYANEEQIKDLLQKFSSPSTNAGVVRRQVSYSARWDQLDVKGDKLIIDAKDPTFSSRYIPVTNSDGSTKLAKQKASPVEVLSNDILYISTSSDFVVPKEAMILVSGENPADYWHYLLLYLVLAFFIVFNVVSLGKVFFTTRKK